MVSCQSEEAVSVSNVRCREATANLSVVGYSLRLRLTVSEVLLQAVQAEHLQVWEEVRRSVWPVQLALALEGVSNSSRDLNRTSSRLLRFSATLASPARIDLPIAAHSPSRLQLQQYCSVGRCYSLPCSDQLPQVAVLLGLVSVALLQLGARLNP